MRTVITKRVMPILTLSVLGLSSAALGDITINPSDFAIGNVFHGPSGGQDTITVTDNFGAGPVITGLSFDGTVNSVAGAVQTHLLLTVIDPDGNTWTFGGTDTTTPNPWSATPLSGVTTLTESFSGAFGAGSTALGEWTFMFNYDFAGVGEVDAVKGQEWSNVSLTLHQVPAPAGLALLGVAALGSRRRRRS